MSSAHSTTSRAGGAALAALVALVGLVFLAPSAQAVATFSVTPTSKAFGSQVVGTSSASQVFTVTNTGADPLIIDTASLTGVDANQFTESSDNCSGMTLLAGATCTVQVAFAPNSTGTKTATLRFVSNAPNSPNFVGLTGTGVSAQAATFSVTPKSKSFGGQKVGTTSPTQTFTVTNTGADPLIITGASLIGVDSNQFAEISDNCTGATLNTGATCTVQVAFAPSSTGMKTAELRIVSNAATSPDDVALTGTGTPANPNPNPNPIPKKASCLPDAVTIVGTDGDDVLRGTPGRDVIRGKAGNDVIFGLDANDRVCGGAGDDVIRGGRGNDALSGGLGNDRIFGGAGSDFLAGGAGNDFLDGGSGSDRLSGGPGRDAKRR